MKSLAVMVAAVWAFAACDAGKSGAPTAASTGAPVASAQREGADEKVDKRGAGEARPQRRVSVSVGASGYEPATVEAAADEPITLVFKRTTDEGCGQQLVFPETGIRRDLPLNQEVEVELTPKKDQSIAFTCGMGMYRGSVVATAR